ncbi:MAG: hypothetical protein GVY28_08065 [Alphaproteobacteria bacterium]|jgi:hypothetical protein|nr:hypothetical protein [Alphaproteobacteria bacterium]
MQYTVIIGLSILSCVIYGILHDQVTARICVEYFTMGHAPLFNTTSPTLLGIAWGIVATWWVGLILGIPIALAARVGRWPKRTAAHFVKSIAILMLACGCCAVSAGFIGNHLASGGKVRLPEPLASRVPQERHVAFLTDLWAHSASYLGGFVGGIVLVVVTIVGRARAAKQEGSQPAVGQVSAG